MAVKKKIDIEDTSIAEPKAKVNTQRIEFMAQHNTNYGTFMPGDVATVSSNIADSLISRGIAKEV